MEKIDWVEAKKYYFSDTNVSYRDVAAKFGVSKTAVENHATKEGWPDLRHQLGELAFEEFKNKLLDQKSQASERHLLQYRNIQSLANKAIAVLDKNSYARDTKGRLVLDEDGRPIPAPPDPYDLKALAQTLKVSIDGERVVLGLPTAVTGISDPLGQPIVPVAVFDLTKPDDEDIDEASRRPHLN